jgi:hypothetical protein
MPEPSDDVAVDLDDLQVVEAPQQRSGQGAQTRANLDQQVVPSHSEQIDDIGNDLLIDQEVLAKALAREVRSSCAQLA